MNARRRGLIQAYIAVIFMGAGITVVQTIPLPPPTLVWYRVAVALPGLLLYALIRKSPLAVPKRLWPSVIAVGLLTGLHWISLFFAITYSTVALGMISFYTFPVFATLLEAFIQKRKPLTRDLIVTVITLGGVILLTPLTGASKDYLPGVFIGMLSATLWAGRVVLVHHRLKELPGISTMLWSLTVIVLGLSPLTLQAPPPWQWQASTLYGVLFLGLFVTALCHTILLSSLRNISATLMGQISPVQIVSASIVGWLALQEPLTPRIIIGGSLIAFTGLIAAKFFTDKPATSRRNLRQPH
ncbi:DMT family transporter [Kiritimatiellota bacterium B12222]|nr:DMT family transporter [Kiritimatiellota bacterium B12222]